MLGNYYLHTYNWQSFRHLHTVICTYLDLEYMWRFPLALFPLADSLFAPFLSPFTWLETLLAVTGSCPPQSQVACKLTLHLHPSPSVSHSEIPTPCGLPVLMRPFTKTKQCKMAERREWNYAHPSRMRMKWCIFVEFVDWNSMHLSSEKYEEPASKMNMSANSHQKCSSVNLGVYDDFKK